MDLIKESNNHPDVSVSNFANWLEQFKDDRHTVATVSWQQLPFYDFLNSTADNVLVFNCYDPVFPGENNTNLLPHLTEANKRNNIRVVGSNTDDYLNYWCLGFDKSGQFKQYTKEELTGDFTKSFLCYQRKNTGQRWDLYQTLQKFQAFGTATLGKEQKGDWDIPNDINSLGDMKVWNSHLINIVSETQYEWRDPNNIFISEKTWKPIYGMRPFLHFSNIYINDFLKQQGFELFWEDFDIEYNNEMQWPAQIQMINRVLEQLKDVDLNQVYSRLLPKIEHNKDNLNKFIQTQKDKIEQIKNSRF